MKTLIKKALVAVGLMHPAMGVKISAERKVTILRSYWKPGMEIFVETGTEFGGTIKGVRDLFISIYSVELDPEKYHTARRMFKDDANIHLYHGNSGEEIRNIMKLVDRPALVWLDAHGPGEVNFENSPIREELDVVLSHAHHHVVLIDDARHFPVPVIEEIKRMAKEYGYKYELQEGLFRLT